MSSLGRSLLAECDLHKLYTEHHGWLQSWLRGKTGCSQRAADLAQDTFLRVLLARARGAAVYLDQPRAYLTTIARGLVIDHWRRQQLEQAWLEAVAQLPEAEAPSPETHLLMLESLMRIDRLLDRLKPKVRQAFIWAQLEGLTCPQIAQRLEVSLATVERYLATALRACYALHFEE